MATLTTHVRDDDAPEVTVLTMRDGRRWIVVNIGHDITLHLPSEDAACARYARVFAAALTVAADEIDAALSAQRAKFNPLYRARRANGQ